ncbi:nuclear transport factor 2 family protein [Spirosoma sp. KCTC 42546]|uniref:nuclear transport factor 2 family protein n=1 Tax=Spirosoma sp. KCTC 42546 TaxID=2520506 RepID=UPI00143DAE0E|nr:nuclear transport factor 2 family protein [Spirosoma sp. KCTC 42546]
MQIIQQEVINKSIIRDFYRRAVSQGDLDFAREIIADDYIQHSPMVKPGKEGLLEALAYMKQMPKPATTSTPFLRLIAEGEYVVTNMSFGWGDKQKIVVDLFRFRDGQVTEHWDAIEDQPETTRNGNPMMDGPLSMDASDLTIANKALVSEFYERVFVNHQLDVLPDFVDANLIQHIPDIDNGLAGLKNYLQQETVQLSVEKVTHIIAEGDFVVVQAVGKLEQKTTTFYSIFRLSEGKIVEQWGVKQIVS